MHSLLYLWDKGVVGWNADMVNTYKVLSLLYNIQASIHAFAGGKPKKLPDPDTFFPELKEFNEVPLEAKLARLQKKWRSS